MSYTGTGDEGYTGLIGGERTAKDAPRIEALGALDEATSAIGVARAFCAREASQPVLLRAQRALYLLMAEIAAPDPTKLSERISAAHVQALEAEIAALDGGAVTRHTFIIPGDTRGGAMLDCARTVVRRAERRVVSLAHRGDLHNEQLVPYLNRLSSLLYVLARADDTAAGVASTIIG